MHIVWCRICCDLIMKELKCVYYYYVLLINYYYSETMRIASNNAEAALLMAAYHVRVAGIVMHR